MDGRFTTNLYKVLEVLYDNRIKTSDMTYCTLSQEDISGILGINRMTVNSAIKTLIENDYITMARRSRYHLTEKGLETVRKAKAI